MSTITPQSRITRAKSVLFNDLDDAIVMMDIDRGQYYDLAGPAARIWALLQDHDSVSGVCAALVEEFAIDPDTCRADTIAFLEELRGLDLIEVA